MKQPQERLVTAGKNGSNGQACFTGKSNELTKSSGYTQASSRAMALSFLGHNKSELRLSSFASDMALPDSISLG